MKYFLGMLGLFASLTAYANVVVPIYTTDAAHQSLGTVTFAQTKFGLLVTPNLHGLTPGIHGFHLHDKASCADAGMAAGGHWDAKNTKKHLGPYQSGHTGDLPALAVDANGNATIPVLAPQIELKNITGHALMIHAQGDNYSDTPQPLGGGGARIACGVID